MAASVACCPSASKAAPRRPFAWRQMCASGNARRRSAASKAFSNTAPRLKVRKVLCRQISCGFRLESKARRISCPTLKTRLAARGLDIIVDDRLERRQRHSAADEYGFVEFLYVEARAQRRLCLFAQTQNRELAQHVSASLTRPHA